MRRACVVWFLATLLVCDAIPTAVAPVPLVDTQEGELIDGLERNATQTLFGSGEDHDLVVDGDVAVGVGDLLQIKRLESHAERDLRQLEQQDGEKGGKGTKATHRAHSVPGVSAGALIRAPIFGGIAGLLASPMEDSSGSSESTSSSSSVSEEGMPKNDVIRGGLAGATGAMLSSIFAQGVEPPVEDDELTPEDVEAIKSGKAVGKKGQAADGLSKTLLSGLVGAGTGVMVAHGLDKLSPDRSDVAQTVVSGAVASLAGEAVFQGVRYMYDELDSLDEPLPEEQQKKGFAEAETALAAPPVCRVIDRPNENGDGLVKISEFMDAFDHEGDAELSEQEVMAMFDLDGNEELSREEVEAAKRWFSMVDQDHNGIIDARELAAHFDVDQDGYVSLENIASELFDLDKDGIVSQEEVDAAARWMSDLPFVDEWTSGLVGKLELTVPPRLELDMRFFTQLPTWKGPRDRKCMFTHYSTNFQRLRKDLNSAFSFFETVSRDDQVSRQSDLGRLRIFGHVDVARKRLDPDNDGVVTTREVARRIGEDAAHIPATRLRRLLDEDDSGIVTASEVVRELGVSRRTAEHALTGFGGALEAESSQLRSALDADGDGWVTLEDIAVIFDAAQGPVAVEWRRLFNSVVSVERFVRAFATKKEDEVVPNVVPVDVLRYFIGSSKHKFTRAVDGELTAHDLDINQDGRLTVRELALVLYGDGLDHEGNIISDLKRYTPVPSHVQHALYLLHVSNQLFVPCCDARKRLGEKLDAYCSPSQCEADPRAQEEVCGEALASEVVMVSFGQVASLLADRPDPLWEALTLVMELKVFPASLLAKFERDAEVDDPMTVLAGANTMERLCDGLCKEGAVGDYAAFKAAVAPTEKVTLKDFATHLLKSFNEHGALHVALPLFSTLMSFFVQPQQISTALDKDGSGGISLSEVQDVVAEVHHNAKQSVMPTAAQSIAEAILTGFGSQYSINVEKLMRAIVRGDKGASFNLIVRFFDSDKDGEISPQETNNARAWFDTRAAPRATQLMSLFEMLINFDHQTWSRDDIMEALDKDSGSLGAVELRALLGKDEVEDEVAAVSHFVQRLAHSHEQDMKRSKEVVLSPEEALGLLKRAYVKECPELACKANAALLAESAVEALSPLLRRADMSGVIAGLPQDRVDVSKLLDSDDPSRDVATDVKAFRAFRHLLQKELDKREAKPLPGGPAVPPGELKKGLLAGLRSVCEGKVLACVQGKKSAEAEGTDSELMEQCKEESADCLSGADDRAAKISDALDVQSSAFELPNIPFPRLAGELPVRRLISNLASGTDRISKDEVDRRVTALRVAAAEAVVNDPTKFFYDWMNSPYCAKPNKFTPLFTGLLKKVFSSPVNVMKFLSNVPLESRGRLYDAFRQALPDSHGANYVRLTDPERVSKLSQLYRAMFFKIVGSSNPNQRASVQSMMYQLDPNRDGILSVNEVSQALFNNDRDKLPKTSRDLLDRLMGHFEEFSLASSSSSSVSREHISTKALCTALFDPSDKSSCESGSPLNKQARHAMAKILTSISESLASQKDKGGRNAELQQAVKLQLDIAKDEASLKEAALDGEMAGYYIEKVRGNRELDTGSLREMLGLDEQVQAAVTVSALTHRVFRSKATAAESDFVRAASSGVSSAGDTPASKAARRLFRMATQRISPHSFFAFLYSAYLTDPSTHDAFDRQGIKSGSVIGGLLSEQLAKEGVVSERLFVGKTTRGASSQEGRKLLNCVELASGMRTVPHNVHVLDTQRIVSEIEKGPRVIHVLKLRVKSDKMQLLSPQLFGSLKVELQAQLFAQMLVRPHQLLDVGVVQKGAEHLQITLAFSTMAREAVSKGQQSRMVKKLCEKLDPGAPCSSIKFNPDDSQFAFSYNDLYAALNKDMAGGLSAEDIEAFITSLSFSESEAHGFARKVFAQAFKLTAAPNREKCGLLPVSLSEVGSDDLSVSLFFDYLYCTLKESDEDERTEAALGYVVGMRELADVLQLDKEPNEAVVLRAFVPKPPKRRDVATVEEFQRLVDFGRPHVTVSDLDTLVDAVGQNVLEPMMRPVGGSAPKRDESGESAVDTSKSVSTAALVRFFAAGQEDINADTFSKQLVSLEVFNRDRWFAKFGEAMVAGKGPALRFYEAIVRETLVNEFLFDPSALLGNLKARFWKIFANTATMIDTCDEVKGCAGLQNLADATGMTMHNDLRIEEDKQTVAWSDANCVDLFDKYHGIDDGEAPERVTKRNGLISLKHRACQASVNRHFRGKLEPLAALLNRYGSHSRVHECAVVTGNELQVAVWTGKAAEVLLDAYFHDSTRQSEVMSHQLHHFVDPSSLGFVRVPTLSNLLGVTRQQASLILEGIPGACYEVRDEDLARFSVTEEAFADKVPAASGVRCMLVERAKQGVNIADEGDRVDFLAQLSRGVQAPTDGVVAYLGSDGAGAVDLASLRKKLEESKPAFVSVQELEDALNLNPNDDLLTARELAVVLAHDTEPTKEEIEAAQKFFENLGPKEAKSHAAKVQDIVARIPGNPAMVTESQLATVFPEGTKHHAGELIKRTQRWQTSVGEVVDSLHAADLNSKTGLTVDVLRDFLGETGATPTHARKMFAKFGAASGTERLNVDRMLDFVTDKDQSISLPRLAKLMFDVQDDGVTTQDYVKAKVLVQHIGYSVRADDLRAYLDPHGEGLSLAELDTLMATAAVTDEQKKALIDKYKSPTNLDKVDFSKLVKSADPRGTGVITLAGLSHALFGEDDAPTARKILDDVRQWRHVYRMMNHGRKQRDSRLIRSTCPPALSALCEHEPSVSEKNLFVLAALLNNVGQLDAGVVSGADGDAGEARSDEAPTAKGFEVDPVVIRARLDANANAVLRKPNPKAPASKAAPAVRHVVENIVADIMGLGEVPKAADGADMGDKEKLQDQMVRLVAAMTAVAVPEDVSATLSRSDLSDATVDLVCASLQESVSGVRQLTGADVSVATLVRYAVWMSQARAMGSNQVVSPKDNLMWRRRQWSRFGLTRLGTCPNTFPEFHARFAAMHNLHPRFGQMPKVDFLPVFDDDALTHLARCVERAGLEACEVTPPSDAPPMKWKFGYRKGDEAGRVLVRERVRPCVMQPVADSGLTAAADAGECGKRATAMGMVFDFQTNALTCALLGGADSQYLVSDHEVGWKGTKADAEEIEAKAIPAWLAKAAKKGGADGDH